MQHLESQVHPCAWQLVPGATGVHPTDCGLCQGMWDEQDSCVSNVGSQDGLGADFPREICSVWNTGEISSGGSNLTLESFSI